MKNKIISIPFLTTLFIKQNKWHKHSVLIHTLKVLYYSVKNKRYDFIMAALLHDIGKPFVSFQDEKDKINNTYSFTNHEEMSYQIIKKWPISQKTKNLVRYHYLIRDLVLSKRRNKILRLNRLEKIWNKLDQSLIKDLEQFIIFDDLGKGVKENSLKV